MVFVGFVLIALLSFLIGMGICSIVDDIKDGTYRGGSIFLIVFAIGMLVIACLGTTFEAQQKISTRTPYQVDTLVTTRNGQEPDTLYIYKH